MKFQDAHEYIEEAANNVLLGLNSLTDEESMTICMNIDINGIKAELPLWSVDVSHILNKSFEAIRDFAESQYVKD